MSTVVSKQLTALVHYSLGRAVSATPGEAAVIGEDLVDAIRDSLADSFNDGLERGRARTASSSAGVNSMTPGGGGGSGR